MSGCNTVPILFFTPCHDGHTNESSNDMNSDNGRLSNLSLLQDHVLSFISIVPAILATAASGIILYLVVQSSGLRNSSYKRILFGLSIADIISATTYAIQPFLLPAATSQRYWASGNGATCSMLGVMIQLGFSVHLYTGILSYYYLLTIRFGVHESTFARRIEPFMHAFGILLPLSTATVGASLGAYSEVDVGFGCWIADYPRGCDKAKGECLDDKLEWLFGVMWVIFIIASVLVINVVIYCHVRKTMRRGRRHSLNAQQQTKRMNDVAVQAFLYVAAYIGTYIWIIIVKLLDTSRTDTNNESQLFGLLILSRALFPSTGIWNLGIYLRPRYIKTRTDFANESRWWAVKRALYGESIPPTTTTCALSASSPAIDVVPRTTEEPSKSVNFASPHTEEHLMTCHDGSDGSQ